MAAVRHDVIHGLLSTKQRTQADALREIGMHAVSRTIASNHTQHLTSSIPPVCFSALLYILYGNRIAFKFSAVLSASPSVPIGSGNLSPGGACSRRERSSATSTESDIPPRPMLRSPDRCPVMLSCRLRPRQRRSVYGRPQLGRQLRYRYMYGCTPLPACALLSAQRRLCCLRPATASQPAAGSTDG